jgi:hypothetical protein
MPAPTLVPQTLYFTAVPTVPNSYAAPIPVYGTETNADRRVLLYALAAERLETALYTQAYARLTDGTDGTNPVIDPQTGVQFVGLHLAATNPIVQYVNRFRAIEAAHGAFLTQALSLTTDPFAGIVFAFGLGSMTTDYAIGGLIYTAELTGVSAYTGAIPSFASGPATDSYIQIAAAILGTEARHTTAVAIGLNAVHYAAAGTPIETAPLAGPGTSDPNGTTGPGTDKALTPDQILNQGSGANAIPGAAVIPSGNGSLPPVSGPNGVAIDAVNHPTYTGFVYTSM